jgi:hypothetical protein
MRIYKFLAFVDAHDELYSESMAKLNKRYSRLWPIKAKRATKARKMALARLERLAAKTKLPWTLMEEETKSIIGKADGGKAKYR